MYIHTIKKGDTIFSIGRRYSVPPTTLMDSNGLTEDRLPTGAELLVPVPTRVATVRGGDSVSKLSVRFKTRKNALLAANPALMGDEGRLLPGKVITIKYGAPKLSSATAIGFFKKSCPRERFSLCLPYIAYVVFECGTLTPFGIVEEGEASDVVSLALGAGKIPLASLKISLNEDNFKNRERRGALIEKIITFAKRENYKGVLISPAPDNRLPENFADFLLDLRRGFMGCDLILFLSMENGIPPEYSELCDGAIIPVEKDGAPTKKETLLAFARAAESSKAHVMLPTVATVGEGEITIGEALKTAYKSAEDISLDEERGLCYFHYNSYKGGRRRNNKISYPSLYAIKSEFEDISDLGYVGIAFDMENVPVSYLCMFNCLFARADYGLPSSDDI